MAGVLALAGAKEAQAKAPEARLMKVNVELRPFVDDVWAVAGFADAEVREPALFAGFGIDIGMA